MILYIYVKKTNKNKRNFRITKKKKKLYIKTKINRTTKINGRNKINRRNKINGRNNN